MNLSHLSQIRLYSITIIISESFLNNVEEYISGNIAKIVEQLSSIVKVEEVKHSIEVAKELRDILDTKQKYIPMGTELYAEQAQLIFELQNDLSSLQYHLLYSTEELKPFSNEILQKVKEVATRLYSDVDAILSTVNIIIPEPLTQEFNVKELHSVEIESKNMKSTKSQEETKQIGEKLNIEINKDENMTIDISSSEIPIHNIVEKVIEIAEDTNKKSAENVAVDKDTKTVDNQISDKIQAVSVDVTSQNFGSKVSTTDINQKPMGNFHYLNSFHSVSASFIQSIIRTALPILVP